MELHLMIRALFLALFLFSAPATAQVDPKAAVEELLAADRAFSTVASNAGDPAIGLAAMFDKEVIVPSPKGHVRGGDAALALFRENPSYKEGKVSWTPVRGGISADGTQGFTYGFLSLTGGDPARRERKYLSYWARQPEGWRVVAYRQQVREAGEVSKEMIAPSLPAFVAEPKDDPELIAGHNRSVAAAEKAFSDRAQLVGLKAAFREYGREDAMNMYDGAGHEIECSRARLARQRPAAARAEGGRGGEHGYDGKLGSMARPNLQNLEAPDRCEQLGSRARHAGTGLR